ncbi:uncharacterized protein LOC126668707 [Mercurialis annua]|uniref:uncharacterized protein LOC126668707 n=1 Tax=Mercurialis annua TaxID=3986 RepID=UPI0024AD89A6|nr:uncharacterized protein LOC126668707 [Mercurialis annua]
MNSKPYDPTETVEINSTGMYYLYFMFCNPELKGTLIQGRTVWKNPNGYLPGKMTPLMSFYGFMSLAYLVLGAIWFLRFVQFWKDVIQLHYHITAVIALGMCEMAIWYYEYANFNSTGTRPMGVTLWAVTFSTVKKTLSRLLLLVVSMGFGVVKPTLGGIQSKVLFLGLAYFIASESLELVEHLGNINDLSKKTELFFVLPVAFLDSCFIVWIFSSLSKTLEKLQTAVVPLHSSGDQQLPPWPPPPSCRHIPPQQSRFRTLYLQVYFFREEKNGAEKNGESSEREKIDGIVKYLQRKMVGAVKERRKMVRILRKKKYSEARIKSRMKCNILPFNDIKCKEKVSTAERIEQP